MYNFIRLQQPRTHNKVLKNKLMYSFDIPLVKINRELVVVAFVKKRNQ